ncbi:SUKH-3 domain-containing protein [Micromonospora sp. NPDC049051]|uniref:SUKH-3 domain-containing protein n=1 Tax=Micromonospora sp. NPDC049051 TaxID=3364264 RepID=UPI0037123F92
MIQPAEAHEIARRWARGFHPDAGVRLEPFELGYVAYRTAPEHAEQILDAQVTIVIDDDTREITPFAALPVAAVVRLYRAKRAAEKRFSAPLRGLLSLSGWRPARDIGLAMDEWWSRGAPASRAMPAAVRTVVAEFGGLHLLPAGLSFVPRHGAGEVEMLHAGGVDAVVIGARRRESVAIDEDGRVWLGDGGAPRTVADSFDTALPQLLGLAI